MPYQTATLTLRPAVSATPLKPLRWTNNDGAGWTTGSGIHATFPPTTPVGGNVLTFFTVTGFWYDIEQQNPSNSTILPQLLNVSAFVDFIPRLPAGFACLVQNLNHADGTAGDTEVPIAAITGRLLQGSLRSIALGDPVGVGLLANSPVLNLAQQLQALNWGTTSLIYDVRFRNVTYGGAPQQLKNFGFYAPPIATTVSLTSASGSASGVQQIPYGGP